MKKYKLLIICIGTCLVLMSCALVFTAPLVQMSYTPQNAEPFFTDTVDRVNLNTAPAEEIATLSGIGDTLANRIVAYRQENGAFDTIQDLAKVQGVSADMVEMLADKIDVEG